MHAKEARRISESYSVDVNMYLEKIRDTALQGETSILFELKKKDDAFRLEKKLTELGYKVHLGSSGIFTLVAVCW